MELISQIKHYDFDSIENLLNAKVILKVSVTEEKSVTSAEVRIHKYSFFFFCIIQFCQQLVFIKSVVSIKVLVY